MEMWCYSCLLVFVIPLAVSAEEPENVTVVAVTSPTVSINNLSTKPTQISFWSNFEMMQRAFYVLVGISVLAVIYFVIRTCRLQKKPKKMYGLLSEYDETVELESMDSDEEKIFESRSLRR